MSAAPKAKEVTAAADSGRRLVARRRSRIDWIADALLEALAKPDEEEPSEPPKAG